MPIYEYVCPACRHPFERRVAFADAEAVMACPACGHEGAVKRVSLMARRSATATASAGAACGPVG